MPRGWTFGRRSLDLGAVDVVVLGGGCAGVTAAVEAARTGASVLLIEREGTLGGTSTAVLDTFYGFYAPGNRATRVVGGLPWEVVERLTAADTAFERPNTYGAGVGVTYNPEVLRILWDDLAHEAGVQVLLHTALIDVEVAENRWEGRLRDPPGCRSRLSDDHARGELDAYRLEPFALLEPDQQADCHAAHLLKGLADGRQCWGQHRGDGRVVEADDREVGGHAERASLGGAYRPHGEAIGIEYLIFSR